MSTRWTTVGIVKRAKEHFAALIGGAQRLFRVRRRPDVERVTSSRGLASPPSARRSRALERRRIVGVLTVQPFWPFSVAGFAAAPPRVNFSGFGSDRIVGENKNPTRAR